MRRLLLLLLVLPACSHSPTAYTRPLPAETVAEFQTCSDTTDCIRVDNGCCDCANGGATVAINRKFEGAFRAHFDCRRTMCTQRAGDCMFREPVCLKGKCELGERPKVFPKN